MRRMIHKAVTISIIEICIKLNDVEAKEKNIIINCIPQVPMYAQVAICRRSSYLNSY